jgi:HSP20 family molecular chaperone IbpA
MRISLDSDPARLLYGDRVEMKRVRARLRDGLLPLTLTREKDHRTDPVKQSP